MQTRALVGHERCLTANSDRLRTPVGREGYSAAKQ